MKIALGLLLCFSLIGCKELELGKSGDDVTPVPCDETSVPLALVLPQDEIRIINTAPSIRYRFYMENKVLWDSCNETSEYEIYSVNITPSHENAPGSLSLTGYFTDVFYYYADTRVQVFKLDGQCQPDVSALLDRMIPIRISQSYESGSCGEKYLRERKWLEIKLPSESVEIQ